MSGWKQVEQIGQPTHQIRCKEAKSCARGKHFWIYDFFFFGKKTLKIKRQQGMVKQKPTRT